MIDALFFTSCAVLAVVPVIFIWHSVYEDGIVGRLALGNISLWGWILVMEEVFDDAWKAPTEYVWLVASLALFLCWHLFRFERRVLRNGEKSILSAVREELLNLVSAVRFLTSKFKK